MRFVVKITKTSEADIGKFHLIHRRPDAIHWSVQFSSVFLLMLFYGYILFAFIPVFWNADANSGPLFLIILKDLLGLHLRGNSW